MRFRLAAVLLCASFSVAAAAGQPDPEKVAALHRTADAMDAIGVVGERLTVIVGAELATELEDLFQMNPKKLII